VPLVAGLVSVIAGEELATTAILIRLICRQQVCEAPGFPPWSSAATGPIVASCEAGALTVDSVGPEKHREEDYCGERNTK